MNEPRWMFDELNRLIVCVQDIYSRNYKRMVSHCGGKVNLKRFKVCDIDINGVIYNNMMEYTRFLNEKSAEIMLQLLEACSCQVLQGLRRKTLLKIKFKGT